MNAFSGFSSAWLCESRSKCEMRARTHSNCSEEKRSEVGSCAPVHCWLYFYSNNTWQCAVVILVWILVISLCGFIVVGVVWECNLVTVPALYRVQGKYWLTGYNNSIYIICYIYSINVILVLLRIGVESTYKCNVLCVANGYNSVGIRFGWEPYRGESKFHISM